MLPGTIIMLILIIVIVFGGAVMSVVLNLKSEEKRSAESDEIPEAEGV